MELLKVAKDKVPDTLWSSTPLMLRATAGLRLLPGEKANILLDKVRAENHKICIHFNKCIYIRFTFTHTRIDMLM